SAEEIIECANKLTEIGEAPTGLILIDTVSRALFGGDENSPKDMGSLVGNLAYIQEQTRAHVAALHHIPADGTQRLRGHGALLGACDTTIKVESLNGCRAATVDKVNDGPDGERVTFDLKSVELHFDTETNTSTTAPILVAAEASAIISAGPQLSPNQRSVLNLIGDPKGIPQEELFNQAKQMGIGRNRRATLYDICRALKDKGLAYEFDGRWFLSN